VGIQSSRQRDSNVTLAFSPCSLAKSPCHLGSLVVIFSLCAAPSSGFAADAVLANAAEKQDWKFIDAMLQKNRADINTPQADGMTALHWAVYHDNADLAKQLLAEGADAKAENRYGITPLSIAAKNGNDPIVKALLAAGADPNTTVRGDASVLMIASRVGKLEAVQALLDAGAKVDTADRSGQTALMWAAAEGNTRAVEALIKAGADPKAQLRSGFTPMLFAVRAGRMETVKALLKAGIDANDPVQSTGRGGGVRNGTSPLMMAIENGHFELAAALIDAGADPKDDRTGFTPLHALTWVRKPNRGDDDGTPPPAGSGNLTSLQFARILVQRGANVNAPLARGSSGPGRLNLAGATPFLMASKTADLDYMKLLVELGADVTLTTRDGDTPLMAAAGLGTPAAGEIAGTEPECLLAAQYLLSLGADPNVVDRNGETAMHGAAYKNLPTMVEFLASHGAKVEIWNQKNRWGWTPLLIAQGYRPGNFKPSAETIDAIEKAMKAAGVEIPPPPTPTTNPTEYDAPAAQ
jgi:ankyrin repeat protein